MATELKKLNLESPESPSATPTPSQPSQPNINSPKPKMDKKTTPIALVTIILLAIAAGVGSGYGLNTLFPSTATMVATTPDSSSGGVNVGDVFGLQDEKTFKDDAEGIIEKGGLNGEGSHKLIRPGGVSQTVYLTSSVVDLDEFVGHKVKVWGETFAAQEAGWLMDVGRVKVLELNAETPEE